MAESEKKNSLISVTRSFIALIECCEGGEIDLTEAEKQLNTTRRRLYDVANVLEGIGLVEKCGKSKVRWTGKMSSAKEEPKLTSAVSKKEFEIDSMIAMVERELSEFNSSEFFQNYAWVSDADIMKMVDEQNTTVFALKGPKSTTVTVHQNEPEAPFKLVCKSTDGEIDLLQIGKT